MAHATYNRSFLLLAVLAFGHLVVDMHSGSLPALFPELRTAYGLSYTQVGLLMLASQVTSSVIQPVFGLVSDRVSTRWLLPASLAVTAAGLLLVGAATSYSMVMLGVIVMGLGIASYHPEASKLAHYAGGAQKGRALSIFAIGGNIGIALGPALISFGMAQWGMRGTWLFVPVAALGIALILACLRDLYAAQSAGSGGAAASPAQAGALAPKQARAALLLLLVIIFLRSGAHASLLTFVPMYYTDFLGHPYTYSSLLLSVFLLAGAVGTVLGGPASDRYGPRTVILLSFAAATPFVAALALTRGGALPVLLMALAGCSLVASFAVTTVLGQSLLPNNVGMASGLTLGFSVGTGGISATLLGWIADRFGLTAALFAVAGLTFFGGVLAYCLPKLPAAGAMPRTDVGPQAPAERTASGPTVRNASR